MASCQSAQSSAWHAPTVFLKGGGGGFAAFGGPAWAGLSPNP